MVWVAEKTYDSRVPVYPPSACNDKVSIRSGRRAAVQLTTNSRLTIDDLELIKAKLLLELAAGRNATCTSSNDQNRIVRCAARLLIDGVDHGERQT